MHPDTNLAQLAESSLKAAYSEYIRRQSESSHSTKESRKVPGHTESQSGAEVSSTFRYNLFITSLSVLWLHLQLLFQAGEQRAALQRFKARAELARAMNVDRPPDVKVLSAVKPLFATQYHVAADRLSRVCSHMMWVYLLTKTSPAFHLA